MQWIWDKVRCNWEHVQEHIWELGKHFGNSLGTKKFKESNAQIGTIAK
jgi:hypothetical protein